MYQGRWESNPELNDRLIALVRSVEQFSFSQIAKQISNEFHVSLSRSACISRSRRIGLCRDVLGRQPLKPKRPKHFGKGKTTQPAPAPLVELEPVQNLPLLELRANHCRFPIGERPNLLFCCRQKQPDTSYCPEHHRVTHFIPNTK